MLNPEIWAENSENSNKISSVFEPGNEKQMLAYVHVMLKCHEYLMSSKGEDHTKEETWTFWRTNAPTVGPGIKATGARMHLQHAKG